MSNSNPLWNTLYEPDCDEVAAMVAHLADRITAAEWQSLTGLSAKAWTLVAAGKRECDQVIKRVIWFLYMRDTRPDQLGNMETVFMWGKSEGALPKLSKLSAPEREAVLRDYIRMLKNKNRRYSAEEIAETCKVSTAMVLRACTNLRYKAEKHDLSDVYVAGSKWYRVDWRMTCREIAERHSIKLTTVRAARERMVHLPAEVAARNILHTLDSRWHYFWCLWDEYKQAQVLHVGRQLQEEWKKKVDSYAQSELRVIQHEHEKTTDDQLLPDAGELAVHDAGGEQTDRPQPELAGEPGPGAAAEEQAGPVVETVTPSQPERKDLIA